MAIETNTPAQKERLAKVRKMLAEGLNPYTPDPNAKLQTADQGGLERDRAIRRAEALKVRTERSAALTATLEAKWDRSQAFEVELEEVELDGISFSPALPPLPMGMVRCSFCEKPTHEMLTTRGTGPLSQSVKSEVKTDPVTGAKFIEEKVSYFSERVIACPDCVLNIKPSTDKDGHVTKNNIKFPETEG